MSPNMAIAALTQHNSEFDALDVGSKYASDLEILTDWLQLRFGKVQGKKPSSADTSRYYAATRMTQQFVAVMVLARSGLYGPAYGALRTAFEQSLKTGLLWFPGTGQKISAATFNALKPHEIREMVATNPWYALAADRWASGLSDDVHMAMPSFEGMPGKYLHYLSRAVVVTGGEGLETITNCRPFGSHDNTDSFLTFYGMYANWKRCLSWFMMKLNEDPLTMVLRSRISENFPLAEQIAVKLDFMQIAQIMWKFNTAETKSLSILEIHSGKIVTDRMIEAETSDWNLASTIPLSQLDPIVAATRQLKTGIPIPALDKNTKRKIVEQSQEHRSTIQEEWERLPETIKVRTYELVRSWCSAWRIEPC